MYQDQSSVISRYLEYKDRSKNKSVDSVILKPHGIRICCGMYKFKWCLRQTFNSMNLPNYVDFE